MSDHGAEEQLKTLIKSGQKIQAIKFLREHDGCGLKESKERVEAIERLMVEAGEIDASKTVTKGGCTGLLMLIGLASLLFIVMMG